VFLNTTQKIYDWKHNTVSRMTARKKSGCTVAKKAFGASCSPNWKILRCVFIIHYSCVCFILLKLFNLFLARKKRELPFPLYELSITFKNSINPTIICSFVSGQTAGNKS